MELELVLVEILAQDESLMNSGLFHLNLQTPAESGVAECSAVVMADLRRHGNRMEIS